MTLSHYDWNRRIQKLLCKTVAGPGQDDPPSDGKEKTRSQNCLTLASQKLSQNWQTFCDMFCINMNVASPAYTDDKGSSNFLLKCQKEIKEKKSLRQV